MRNVRIALANVNSTVGAFRANADAVIALAHSAGAGGAALVAFPEMVLGGYPAEDYVQWPEFVRKQWVELGRVAQQTAGSGTLVVVGLAVEHRGLVYNAAAMVGGGKIWGVVPKEKLPTYNVFYEGRTLARGIPYWVDSLGEDEHGRPIPFGDLIFQTGFGCVALEVCEDLWSPAGPMWRRAVAGAELVVNVSASPFRIGIDATRRELIATRAADCQCTVAYVNSVGGNDALVFDGGGFLNQNGKWLAASPRFREGVTAAVVDLQRTMRLRSENATWRADAADHKASGKAPGVVAVTCPTATCDDLPATPAGRNYFLPPEVPPVSARQQFCEELLSALGLGVRDYFLKTGAFERIGVALSGGRDSLLTLLVAHRAATMIRPESPGELLQAFYMPSRFSGPGPREAAHVVCAELGVPLTVVSIEEAFDREVASARAMLNGGELTELTAQNIQARIRAARMWNWANTARGLFLQTGNMSEKAVGYTTVGGDLMGGLGVIANLPKTVVMYVLDYLKEVQALRGIALAEATHAGPELAPNQSGEAELMPFPVLDACVYLYVGEKLSQEDMARTLAATFPEIGSAAASRYAAKFIRLFGQNLYKWVQSPLSLHVGNIDIDRERALQVPVVARTP